jgi:hypothetical protein
LESTVNVTTHVEDVLNTLDGFDLTCIGLVLGSTWSRAERGVASVFEGTFCLGFITLVWLVQSGKVPRRST